MRKFYGKKSFSEIKNEYWQSSTFEKTDSRPLFNVVELDSFKHFLKSLDHDCRKKIGDIIDRAREEKSSALLKKLVHDIWEFRVNYKSLHYRLLAFWYTVDKPPTVFLTHGFIKKTNKTPIKELSRAIEIRSKFLNDKLR